MQRACFLLLLRWLILGITLLVWGAITRRLPKCIIGLVALDTREPLALRLDPRVVPEPSLLARLVRPVESIRWV